ncbi:MAG: T9SS type A sorting domain-containing protein [Lewinellaceae bacterium]|nr:T9SS type A sorting domain-containing protein [Lewinellaceae bacterium]
MVLFNAGGSVIREYSLDSIQETTLDLDNLSNGMYLLSVTGINGYTTTSKLSLLR